MTPSIYTSVYSGTAITTTTTGNAVQLNQVKGEIIIFRLNFTNNSGTTPTLDVKIQHCPLTDGTFTDLVSFTQATTGTGTYEVHVPRATMGVFRNVKAVGTLAGTSPNYTYTVECYSD